MAEVSRSYLQTFIVDIILVHLLVHNAQFLLHFPSATPRIIQIKVSIFEVFLKTPVLVAECILNVIGIK
jgi:hypothetical protein